MTEDFTLLSYLGTAPRIGQEARFAPEAAIIGRIQAGDRLAVGRLATLRADGHDIRIGAGCSFADRSTLHIVDSLLPCIVGDRVTVGRYALVHACTVDDGCVIGDAAVVMDGAVVGAGAVIAAGSLVPPRKRLEGGWLYSGSPAQAVRKIDVSELEALRRIVLAAGASELVTSSHLPPLDMSRYRRHASSGGALLGLAGREPRVASSAYVAPTAVVAGDVRIAADASVWFANVIWADGTTVAIGQRTNIQDNCLLETGPGRGPIIIGDDVTVGHNVRMGSCVVEDGCLIGMGAEVGDRVVVERGGCIGAHAVVPPGTRVKAGHIWAGRPAREFRPVRPEEAEFFVRGKDVYVGYARAYLSAR
ncbi:MAG: gamma carbonic anhydrase family protein [Betaproteobacteria bacterium]|nr:gamma carbonic anhydrase family protein [Betaproteobacteria bacterium]